MRLKRWWKRRTAGALAVEDVLVLAAVVLLPWWWGGIGLGAFRMASAVVAVAAGWALLRRGARGIGLGRGILWLLPAFLLGTWAFVQTVPLPRAWVASLSPKAAALQERALGPEGQDSVAWLRQIEADARARVPEAAGATPNGKGPFALGAEAPSPPARFTLSLLPSSTLEQAFWYAALLLAFLLVHRRTADKGRADLYRAALFVSFAGLALVGILNRVTAPTRILWLRDAPAETHPFGPYVDPSHFAGVMELMAPWILGCGLSAVVRLGGPDRSRTGRLLALVGSGVCAVAAVLSASKMAAATIGCAYVVLIAVAVGVARGRGRTVLLAGTVAVALLLGSLAVVGPLAGRLDDFVSTHTGDLAPNLRGLVWSAGFRLARDYPWTGIGFGALGQILPAYLPRGEAGYWSELHNDYFEVYVAGGFVALALVAWLTAAFAARVWRVFRSEASSGRLLPMLGLVLGLVALATHEFVDFNLQIPANALLFVVTAAMCVSPLARSTERS